MRLVKHEANMGKFKEIFSLENPDADFFEELM
jgi:hypothetical protein